MHRERAYSQPRCDVDVAAYRNQQRATQSASAESSTESDLPRRLCTYMRFSAKGTRQFPLDG